MATAVDHVKSRAEQNANSRWSAQNGNFTQSRKSQQ